MHEDYKKLIQKANLVKNENQKFLVKLKKQAPKNLDQITNQFHDEAFETIDCLKCANCCRTTGPLLLNKDIDKLAKNEKLKPSVFTEKYLKIDEDNDYVFKQMPCPFLGSDNYCNVYESRPNACKEFPHTQQRNILQKLKITELNAQICPAVYLVIEKLKVHFNQ
jgi:Fe-S-cluster containining protein